MCRGEHPEEVHTHVKYMAFALQVAKRNALPCHCQGMAVTFQFNIYVLGVPIIRLFVPKIHRFIIEIDE
jgi:hypothetical protein